MESTRRIWPRSLQIAVALTLALLYVTAVATGYSLSAGLAEFPRYLLAFLAFALVGVLNFCIAHLADASCFEYPDPTPLTGVLVGAFMVVIVAAFAGAIVGCLSFVRYLIDRGLSFAEAMGALTALSALVALALYLAFRRGLLR